MQLLLKTHNSDNEDFNLCRRPSWNQTTKLGHQVTVIRRPATTLELQKLKEEKGKEETMHTHISPLDHLRSLDSVCQCVLVYMCWSLYVSLYQWFLTFSTQFPILQLPI